MTELFDLFIQEIDADWLMQTTEQLWRIELGQTFRHYHRSATFAEELLKREGLSQVERISFPADGKSMFFEAVMPLGWDSSVGRLEAVNCLNYFKDPVLADVARHPFHLIKGSSSTPPGGIVTQLITEGQMYSGADARGKLILGDPQTPPRCLLGPMAQFGAIGVVCDFLPSRYVTPDGIHWANGSTAGTHWHVIAEDDRFIAFAVTPRVGDLLRHVAATNKLMVRAISDGRLFESTIDVVTGVIPGRQKKEFWLQAHLYEPLPDDNSSGVAATAAIAKTLRRLVAAGKIAPPEFTLRVVLAMEFYGFAAYASRLGKDIPRQVIGALNLDGFPHVRDVKRATVIASPPGAPFFGDYLFGQMFRQCLAEKRLAVATFDDAGRYGDDMSLCDSSTGLRTIWMIGAGPLWHNSSQTMDYLCPETLKKAVAVQGSFVAQLVGLDAKSIGPAISQAGQIARQKLRGEMQTQSAKLTNADDAKKAAMAEQAGKYLAFRLEREEARLRDFARIAQCVSEIDAQVALLTLEYQRLTGDLRLAQQASPARREGVSGKTPVTQQSASWADYARGTICRRLTQGLLQDFTRVPKAERRNLRRGKTRWLMTAMLARLDGELSLMEAIERAAWERGADLERIDERILRDIFDSIDYLRRWGYLDVRYPYTITKDDLLQGLRQVGVSRGDIIFVHSSLPAFGHVDGGEAAALDALCEAVGPTGTLLMPTFTSSCIYFAGEPMLDRSVRPFDAADARQVRTGRLCRAFLGLADVVRSGHPSHSVAGIGPLAMAMLAGHQESDPPAGPTSPLAKLLANKGKIVYLGALPQSTTFLHYLEDCLRLSYLVPALCLVRKPDGPPRPVLIQRHLTGHRDFYSDAWQDTKIYKALLAAGLQMPTASLGLGQIRSVESSQLYELGLSAMKQDPTILLCDDPQCDWCARHKQF